MWDTRQPACQQPRPRIVPVCLHSSRHGLHCGFMSLLHSWKANHLSMNCACSALNSVERQGLRGNVALHHHGNELRLRHLNSLLDVLVGTSLCVTKRTFTALSMNSVCNIATIFNLLNLPKKNVDLHFTVLQLWSLWKVFRIVCTTGICLCVKTRILITSSMNCNC